MRRKSRWGCQNQPLARIATSFEGSEGDAGISGHMSSMFEANRELVFPTRLKGTKADEKIDCVKKMTSRVRVFDNMANSYFRERWRLLLKFNCNCSCFIDDDTALPELES